MSLLICGLWQQRQSWTVFVFLFQWSKNILASAVIANFGTFSIRSVLNHRPITAYHDQESVEYKTALCVPLNCWRRRDFAFAVVTQDRTGEWATRAFKVRPVKLEFLVPLVTLGRPAQLDREVQVLVNIHHGSAHWVAYTRPRNKTIQDL